MDNNGFKMSEIDDTIFSRIKGKTFKDDCTLPLEDLRYLSLLHKDIKGNTLKGEMICNKYIAETLKYCYEEAPEGVIHSDDEEIEIFIDELSKYYNIGD